MFDVGPSELLLIVIVAVIVIGPKELPAALRAVGRWIGQMRRVSAHFRTGLDAMIREALTITRDQYYYVPLHHQLRPWAMKKTVETVYKSDDRPEARYATVK